MFQSLSKPLLQKPPPARGLCGHLMYVSKAQNNEGKKTKLQGLIMHDDDYFHISPGQNVFLSW